MGDAALLQVNVRDADPEPFCVSLPNTNLTWVLALPTSACNLNSLLKNCFLRADRKQMQGVGRGQLKAGLASQMGAIIR